MAALSVAASRAGDSSGGLGFVPTGKKAAAKANAESWDLQRVTAGIARATLSGGLPRGSWSCAGGLMQWLLSFFDIVDRPDCCQ